MFIWIYAHASLKLNTHFQFLFRYMVCEFPWKLLTIKSDLATFLPEDPDKTNPNSAEITTQLTGWSWPVNTARGVGVSASPTILWALAFQCHKRTVQSSDPDAKKREKSWNRSGKNIILDPVLPVFLLWFHEIFVIYKYINFYNKNFVKLYDSLYFGFITFQKTTSIGSKLFLFF